MAIKTALKNIGEEIKFQTAMTVSYFWELYTYFKRHTVILPLYINSFHR